ncbi:glycosyl transferase family 1 [Burkholderia ubonensis]|uniref:glycosyltransferase family 4 protein n=1 Tax=Burkholderia ubonensis TaxID=101571 RepID=UPI00075BC6EE|nr:glycosyltransferase family 4 protein [Burkholderia ubonensis]KVP97591.1 glycosyl transferase family 1 [Burkholderia ubonensis]KVT24764.1 glycosyl transferase family 1 [Burkholderia ubonensis]KVU29380.1 glycosyl transferase family 1 [Burkholderia ubonensis]KVW23791.1 glycosyl transferase family 1 [Burkholderia ubonensis]KVW70360.1 glycosyl transferase family 1 [Burkholderia ubonensis]
MPRYQHLLYIAQRVYHRLPLSQETKWRIRKAVSPIIVSLRHGKPIRQALKSALASDALRDHARESRLQRLLLDLARRGVRNVSHIIAVPFLGTGGAENVALNFSKAIREINPDRQVLLVVADRDLVDERIAGVDGVHVVVLSDFTSDDSYALKQALLYDMVLAIRPAVFHNINSEVAWNAVIEQGGQLKRITHIFASIFAFQFADDGKSKIGYAAYFLQPGLPALTALLSDNQRFVIDARNEYRLGAQGEKLQAVYNPSRTATSEWKTRAFARIASRGQDLTGQRPAFLWAGRLDKEKRVDLLMAVVQACPHIDFYVYGQAVVNVSEQLPDMPNFHLMGPFSSPEELVQARAYTGFLFTSKWEGMPNILLEIGTLGVPIVAPAVGGVGELISDATGYLLPEKPDVMDYRAAMESIISHPQEVEIRARALVELIDGRHTWQRFVERVKELEDYGI